jgi:hypothetical protein
VAVVALVMKNKVLTLTYPTWVPTGESILVTNDNFMQVTGDVFHTSLGDISPRNLVEFAFGVGFINFVDEPDSYDLVETYRESLLLAKYFGTLGKGSIVEKPNTFLSLDITNDARTPTLWTFGCSMTYGVGVEYADLYSTKLSKNLNLPLRKIARPSSSTRWSLRHLMNSDISKHDTVVWQITTIERFTVAARGVTEVMLKHAKDRNWAMAQTDEQMFFDQLSLLNYGVNFLRAKGCRFKVISLDSLNPYRVQLIEQYTKYPEFCYIPDWIVDLGYDRQHPGKLSHEILAKHLTYALQYTNE